MSALRHLQDVIRSGRQPNPFLVEEAVCEAIEHDQMELAIAIDDAWPSSYEEDYQESETPVVSPEDPPSPPAVETPTPDSSPHVTSPLKGVPDDAWDDFVGAMKTEDPSFSTEKYVGAFRYRKERFIELGGKDGYDSQYDVFKRDMETQYTQGRAKALIEKYAGHPLQGEHGVIVTSSGLLALWKAAGPRAESWLEKPETRTQFPGTSALFARANGIF